MLSSLYFFLNLLGNKGILGNKGCQETDILFVYGVLLHTISFLVFKKICQGRPDILKSNLKVNNLKEFCNKRYKSKTLPENELLKSLSL